MLHKLFKMFKKDEDVKVSEPEEKVLDISEPITTLLDIYKKYPKRFSCIIYNGSDYLIKYKPKDLTFSFSCTEVASMIEPSLSFRSNDNTLTTDEMRYIHSIIVTEEDVRKERYKTVTMKRNRNRIIKLLKE